MQIKISNLTFAIALMLAFGSVVQVLASNPLQTKPCLEITKSRELAKDFAGGLIVGKIEESIKIPSNRVLPSKPMPNAQCQNQSQKNRA